VRHFSGALVAIAVTLSLASPGSVAQTSSATISGHVVDQTQGIVTNAQVRLVNEQTGVVVTTSVLANGDFLFLDVQPGTFTVVVQAPGFKELRKTNLTMSASQNLSAGIFVLEVGTVSQTISVSGDITPLQTTGQTVASRMLTT
jgi:Carboxypeptidase regulatory-like domain